MDISISRDDGEYSLRYTLIYTSVELNISAWNGVAIKSDLPEEVEKISLPLTVALSMTDGMEGEVEEIAERIRSKLAEKDIDN